MKRFVIGFGVPADRIPIAYPKRIADWKRSCDRPGCGAPHKAHESWIRRTQNKQGWECISHVDDELLECKGKVVRDGLVVAPKDAHGHRGLYLVFEGRSLFLKRVNVAEAGFVAAIGSTMGIVATRISYQEDARGE